MQYPDPASVVAVSRSADHTFSKVVCDTIDLIAGFGVDGDAHAGTSVKHRYRARLDPTQPNLRQVHLIPVELIDDLVAKGFHVAPGILGENVTTRGIDLIGLPTGARLHIGAGAVVEITGLRNPCRQLEDYQSGLKAAVLDCNADGTLMRRAGVMGIVLAGGAVRSDDRITIEMPAQPHSPLKAI